MSRDDEFCQRMDEGVDRWFAVFWESMGAEVQNTLEVRLGKDAVRDLYAAAFADGVLHQRGDQPTVVVE